jgi:hypothetical protein
MYCFLLNIQYAAVDGMRFVTLHMLGKEIKVLQQAFGASVLDISSTKLYNSVAMLLLLVACRLNIRTNVYMPGIKRESRISAMGKLLAAFSVYREGHRQAIGKCIVIGKIS